MWWVYKIWWVDKIWLLWKNVIYKYKLLYDSIIKIYCNLYTDKIYGAYSFYGKYYCSMFKNMVNIQKLKALKFLGLYLKIYLKNK